MRKKIKFTKRDAQLYVMVGAGLVFLAIFAYAPLFGIILAFKDADRSLNILEAMSSSPWCGWENFEAFLLDNSFADVLINTICLNFLMLLINFPMPIIFALILNEVRHQHFKKAVQTITNFPHFISWAIFGGIILSLTDMTTGIVTPLLNLLGLSDPQNPVNLNLAEYFWAEMIIASLIKSVGWGSIIYSAAIAGISRELYEAAEIDGAGRLQKMLRITLPLLMPTVTVFLLLQISRLLGNSYEQFIVFQNDLNLEKSEVLVTYSYKMGLGNRRYSYATAMTLFESVISVILLIGSNFISKKLTGRGIY